MTNSSHPPHSGETGLDAYPIHARLSITPAIFEREIALARTFVYYEDVQALMEKNLIKGAAGETPSS